MPESPSTISAYAAIAGNLAIAVTKFVAAGFTGSSAMLSEGIHSLVDTGDGVLLLVGIHQSKKPPDANHPFGHGKELYFWTFIVAMMIFAVGGGMSIYEGVSHILDPHPLENPYWSYGVLAASAVFEGASWAVAYRQFRKTQRDDRIVRAIRSSKDPSTFTVLFEDSAALVGLVFAFLGILLGQIFDAPYLDGVASVLIGLLLGTVATWLAYESKGLLVGESADAETLASVRRLVQAEPAVEHVDQPLTMHLGPDEVLLNLDIQFRRGLSAQEMEGVVDRLERSIRKRHPEIKRIFLEAESLTGGDRDGG